MSNSTTNLDTKQVSEVWEIINREFGEKLAFQVPPFPSVEEAINAQRKGD